MHKFYPLASSSSGNSYLISFDKINILIDIGIGIKSLGLKLQEIGYELSSINAIFITHEHIDHIKGLGSFLKKYQIPIYATKKTWDYILEFSSIKNINTSNIYIIEPDCCIDFFGISIMAFDVPHDAAQPVGYSIEYNNQKIIICTDCGYITEKILKNSYNADTILVEANHDIDMLDNGPYPLYLKKRISSNKGHLSNSQAALFLKDIITKKTKQIFLGHISKSNNNPMVAFETVKHILESNKILVNQEFCPNLYIITK